MRSTEPYSAASMTAPAWPPRASRAVERGTARGLGREHAGEVVGDRHAGTHRRAVGVAGQVQQPAVADAHPVEAGAPRVGAVLAEAEMRTITSRGSSSPGREAPALEGAGPEVLDDHVAVGGQPAEQVLALGVAQVEGDAAPSASLDRPEQRVAGRRRRRSATNGPISRMKSPRPRLLDLDDLGALLAQQPRAERRGDAGAQVEDADALERAAH